MKFSFPFFVTASAGWLSQGAIAAPRPPPVSPDGNIVVNGGFETGRWHPWIPTHGRKGTRVYAKIADGGKDSNKRLLTNNLFDNRLFEIKQVLHGTPNTQYSCSYDWMFTAYYETPGHDSDGNAVTYVPYIHGYVNDYWTTADVPLAETVGNWHSTEFTYTSNANDGKDTWWFDCASPQPSKCHRGVNSGGTNYLSIDNFKCVPVPT